MTVLRRAWSLVRWFVRLEIGIWRSLFLWVTRRVSGQGPGVEAFAYAKQITPVIAVFVFVSMIELPVVHILLPWETVRLVVDILSVWALLWMIGLLAGNRVFPHLMDERGLRIRSGATIDIHVPWAAIAAVTSRRGSVAGGKSVEVVTAAGGAVAEVPVMKLTRIEIELHEPTAIDLPDGAQEVARLRCSVDDPVGFVNAARERLAACGGDVASALR